MLAKGMDGFKRELYKFNEKRLGGGHMESPGSAAAACH